MAALAYTTARARTYRGRPDPDAPAAGTIYRLHRRDCRYAGGESAQIVTFEQWQLYVSMASPTDDYLLCKVCRPDEDGEA